MTAARFHVLREHLGLTLEDVARVLNVDERTARRWHGGEYTIPAGVWERLHGIETFTAAQITREKALVEATGVAIIYRSDSALWAARPDYEPYPARYHRAIVGNVIAALPHADVEYAQ